MQRLPKGKGLGFETGTILGVSTGPAMAVEVFIVRAAGTS